MASRTVSMRNKPPLATENELKAANHGIQEIIMQLQECWQCDIHMKGLHSPVYCYSLGGRVCHRLTQSNLYSWAADIVGFFSFQVLLFLHIIGRGEGGCGSDAPFDRV